MSDYTERYTQLRKHILALREQIDAEEIKKMEIKKSHNAFTTPESKELSLRRFALVKKTIEHRQNLLNTTYLALHREYIDGVKSKMYVKSDVIISGLKELQSFTTL